MALSLPTKKTQPTTKRLSMLIYGAPKIGKSTFCSRIPNSIFIATEPGLDHLSTYRMDVHSWMEILEALALLSKGDHPFDTVVIDTVDRACAMCAEAIVDKYNKSNPDSQITDIGDIGFGRGYRYMQAEFSRVVNKLFSMGMSVVFTSHETVEQVDTTQGKRTKIVPSFDSRCRQIILPQVDIIANIQIDTILKDDGSVVQNRIMRTLPSTYYESGDRTGKLKDGMPFKYAIFDKLMNGKEESSETAQRAARISEEMVEEQQQQ